MSTAAAGGGPGSSAICAGGSCKQISPLSVEKHEYFVARAQPRTCTKTGTELEYDGPIDGGVFGSRHALKSSYGQFKSFAARNRAARAAAASYICTQPEMPTKLTAHSHAAFMVRQL